jgi:hypothetical protein
LDDQFDFCFGNRSDPEIGTNNLASDPGDFAVPEMRDFTVYSYLMPFFCNIAISSRTTCLSDSFCSASWACCSSSVPQLAVSSIFIMRSGALVSLLSLASCWFSLLSFFSVLTVNFRGSLGPSCWFTGATTL